MATHRNRGKATYLCWYEEDPITGTREEKRKSLGNVTKREADAAVSRYDWEAGRLAAQAVLAISPDNGDAATILAAADRALAA